MANERNPGRNAALTLQPLKDIHLRSEVGVNTGLSDRRRDSITPSQIRIFLLVALIVLIIGGINYVNFAAAGAVVLALTLAAMSLKTIHAARANPVESLRYE